jgi:PKD repeat protein
MKRKLPIYLWATLCGALTMTSCNNDDDKDDATKLTADFTFSVGDNNLVTFTNTSSGSYASSEWNFGDESPVATTKDATHTYPKAGTYHVTLKITASDATEATKQQDVVIEHDDVSGLLTPTVKKLIGGEAIGGERVWVFDQWNLYVAEAAAGAEKSLKGHIGLGPLDSYSSDWWGAGPDEKTGAGWRIYEETFKFSLDNSGLKLDIVNPGGRGYGRLKNDISKSKFSDATAWLDPNNDNAPSDAEAEFAYGGGEYTFTVTEPESEGGYPKLTLTGNAFLGYWVGTQEYDIIYLTNEVLAVRAADPNDGEDNFDWVFVFIRQDLNIEPEPEPDKTLGAVSYPVEGFEETPAFTVAVDPSANGSGIADNPAKTGINTSNKVFKFEKTSDFWSHVYYLDAAHKFDLSTKNKIKVKVYIPSTNDYTTEGGLAGTWLTINTLQKQLVLKLQDNDLGGNSYTTQVEKQHGGGDAPLAVDTWLELTFDFSDVSARTDFDKIIIQFGQEGHNRPGTFYFDDLEFFTE